MTQPDDSIGIRHSDFLRGVAATGASGLAATAVPAAAQDTPPPTTGAEPKPPTQHTLAFNALYREGLDFADDQDFKDARRSLLASLPEPVVIKNSEGKPVWDLAQYAFVGVTERDDAPESVNPSLWRMAKLNMIHGLFEVVDGVWQARGYDLSVMTILRSNSGYVVIDPFISAECAATVWRELVIPKLGDKPIAAVIYTHSHVDHFGGVRGIIKQADIDAGRARILAPPHFTEAAIGENVIAGNAMSRRATYMYGNLLSRARSARSTGA
jgi:alkyl sulfatase BDS1-like metallo-beta-lactamase superfamily hydrolase